jgi:hypothetical protein
MRFLFFLAFILNFQLFAQNEDSVTIEKKILDLQFIDEVENRKGSDKVLHAEPLYIDLIRDLGARKGERELNVGVGLTDNSNYDSYTTLVEYEWAPIDRLGLEVELPFTFYYPLNGFPAPKSQLNSLKVAAQYTFLVSEAKSTSMALGYIHEFETNSFKAWTNKEKVFNGNVFNPFLIAAKRLGNNFHSLVYTGPVIFGHNGKANNYFQMNSNLHYMISGTRNFIGVEFNKDFRKSDFDMVIRPQMRVGISENLMIGIVTGIPIKRESERFSSFLRLIYEPKHKTPKIKH